MIRFIPNILSIGRIVLTPVFIWLYLLDDALLSFFGILVFSIGAISDYYDGYIARKYEVITELGKFIDPLADKVLTFAGFGILPFLNPVLFPWWLVALIILRDVFTTLLRIFAKRKFWPFSTSSLAKWKTAVQLIFLYYVLLLGVAAKSGLSYLAWSESLLQHPFNFWLFFAVTAFTVWSGMDYAIGTYRHLSLRKNE